VLSRLKTRINAHWNEFAQNWWIFAISRNTSGFAYMRLKCGGFLEFSRLPETSIARSVYYGMHRHLIQRRGLALPPQVRILVGQLACCKKRIS
jgi:hypothetical protein